MALIKIEPYGIDDIANYTFGGLTITSNAVFGNASLGNLATANFISVTSNLTSGNASLGNAASANYFIGNGSLLTGITTTSIVNGTSNVVITNNGTATISISGTSNVVTITSTGANVNGYVTATSFTGEAGNLSNIQGANVSGAVSSATTAGTVTTAAQPNITSVGLLANLSVNGNSSFIGNANIVGNINQSAGTVNASNLSVTGNVTLSGPSVTLGDISNLHIAGGSANYVLQTDGAGNLSWSSAGSASTTPGDVVVDNFTGDGANSSFTLSITPDAVKYVIVNIDGVFQLRQSYSLDGNVLTFGSAPLSSSLIEVSTTVPGTILGGGGGSNVDLGNISQDIIPTSNVTYNLGSPTHRWKDIYLSGSTIDLGGATLTTDSNTGTIALVAAPTVDNPNPSALVITSTGGTVIANTTGGNIDFTEVANTLTNTSGFSGSYTDLTNLPTLGTAAATNANAYATAAQGTKADTALQASNLVGYATQTYVGNAIANLVASAPAALDTLNELALALGNDASYSTTITNSLANKLNSNAFTYANISGKPTLGNISIIDLNGNANTVLYGNGVFAAVSGGGSSGANASVGSTPPSSPTAGSLWYDDTTTGELYVYTSNAWVTTSIMPMTTVTNPAVTGPTQANEISTQTFTITNYSASYAYIISVTGGTYARSGNTISWTMPAVTSNTTHYMTTQVVSGGVTSAVDTRTVSVINLNIDDTAIIVSDFSSGAVNNGWIA